MDEGQKTRQRQLAEIAVAGLGLLSKPGHTAAAKTFDDPSCLMSSIPTPEPCGYFPAIVCMVCDSPIDALVALCVRREEAMMLVVASWSGGDPGCIVTTLHGGRPIAVLRTPDGRWAACNAFLGEFFATPKAAGRRLAELLKRGRRGYVGHVRCTPELAISQTIV
jgi:hypothetical protein